MQLTLYKHPERDDPETVPSELLITTVQLTTDVHGYDRIGIWNRGVMCGDLFVKAGDGESITKALVDAFRLRKE